MIEANDPRLTFKGMISLQQSDGAVIPWRLPYERMDFFPDPGFRDRAVNTCGVRLSFCTDADSFKVLGTPLGEQSASAPEGCQIDLCMDDRILHTGVFHDNEILFQDLPEGLKTLELWFSPSFGLAFKGIELPEGAILEKSRESRKKWVTYGSSITHSVRAASPAGTWPAIVARAKGFDLTCLGYGAQCKLDPMVFRMISDLDADLISMKLGINVYNEDYSPRTFQSAVFGGIATIRDRHRTTPLVMASPIFCPFRESTPGLTGNTLVMMRDIIRQCVDTCRKHGDENIHYVDGLDIFDQSLKGYLPDELHPDAKGMEFMAENFMNEVFGKLGLKI